MLDQHWKAPVVDKCEKEGSVGDGCLSYVSSPVIDGEVPLVNRRRRLAHLYAQLQALESGHV